MNKVKINEWEVTVDICPNDNNLFITLQYVKGEEHFARSFEFRVREKMKIVVMDWSKLDNGISQEDAELH